MRAAGLYLGCAVFFFGQTTAPIRSQIPQPVCSYTIQFSAAVPAKDRPLFVLWVNSAVATWKSVAPKAARFAYVDHGPAQMTFVLGPETIKDDKDVVGYCHSFIFDGVRVGTLNVITEYGHWDDQNYPMTAQMIKSVSMHELGHFLGLGHNHRGVMRMFDPERLPLRPSRGEIAEVREKA